MNTNQLSLNIKNLESTKELAREISRALKEGLLICLYGSVGSGKTTFVQSFCKEIGITENVTSPSFVVLNEYYSGKYPVYHFDLYRLEKEGVSTIVSELEEYSSDTGCITFVEWAEFSQDKLLKDRLEITFFYDEMFSDGRLIELEAYGVSANNILERLRKTIVNTKF